MTSARSWSAGSAARARGPFVGFADAADAAVNQLERQLPGMDLWLVTCVVADRQLVVASAGRWADRAPVGSEFSWQASMCVRMVTGQAPPVAPDIGSEPAYRQAAVGPLAGVRAYLGLPLLVRDGELFGTLCALAGTRQPETMNEAMPIVSLLARMLSTVLTRERAAHERSVEAAHAYALADRDPLTALCNRRGFEKAVRTEQGRDQRFGTRSSIVVISLDHPVGIDNGDRNVALRRCADVLTSWCQPGDVAARVDETEFALLAVQADPIGVRALQTRVRQALRTAGLRTFVGSATRRVGEDLDATWARADRAMRIDERRRTHRIPPPAVRAVP